MANLYEKMNAELFKELERLDAAGADDLEAEIARARAVKDIASCAVANANSAIAATRCMYETGQAVKMPRGMIGES